MATRLTTVPDLEPGRICDRLNRFVLAVDHPTDGTLEAYFPNTGGYNLVEPGREVRLEAVSSETRRTDYTVRFVDVNGVWVSAVASFANDAFEAAVTGGHLPWLEDWTITRREPPLPEGGRADFSIESTDGREGIVEVKSCTLAESDIARFPDRPTERGRRHLQALADISDRTAFVVFVVQRPDASRFALNWPVDPAFASAVKDAREAGVVLRAIQLRNDLPAVRLTASDLPISFER